jgi:hypothetical protein
MDKFPEAFRRFEQKVNTDNIETWKQLQLVFGSWAGGKWRPTCKQIDALHIQAKRLGIPTHGYRTREEEVHRIFGQSSLETRVAIAQQREQRFSNIYVNHHEWLNKNTQTTPYQRRIIHFIRNHPNASLAEARGHKIKRS